MKTLKNLIENCHVPEKLIKAVVKQSGGWNDFSEIAGDVANHGADAGFGGWTYYSDTVAFAKKNRPEILEMAEEQSKEFGQGLLEMICGFGVFRTDKITPDEVARAIYQGKGDRITDVLNVLAWYALEEVCRCYTDL